MTQAPSARSKARSVTLAAVVVAAVAVAAACSLSSRAVGEACIKDQDCLSGFCVQSQCQAAPPLLDAEVDGDGYGGAMDSSTGEGSTGDSGTTAADTGTTMADTGSPSGDSSAAETGAGDSGSSDTGTE
jgi:hypothetical protein